MALKNIPIRQKVVTRIRFGCNGELTNKKGIVVGLAPQTNFTRAYGREAFVCVYRGDHVSVTRMGVGNLYPVGRVKRIPKSCAAALRAYEEDYPSLARKKRSRR